VWEARTLQYSNYDVHAAFVPKYSNAKEGAKDFLKYLYSDEGMTVYWNAGKAPQIYTLSGGNKPDTSDWNEWQKEAQERAYTARSFFEFTPGISPIFTRGGAQPYANASIYIVDAFATTSNTDRKTASEVWNIIKNYHTTTWDRYVTTAGL
jgi:ABC-type glycerol-3-phosphate transport system substrate-binding protein